MIPEKRLSIVMDEYGHYSRAVLCLNRNGTQEWARPTDQDNLVLFPGAYREEITYELPAETESIDQLVVGLNDEYL